VSSQRTGATIPGAAFCSKGGVETPLEGTRKRWLKIRVSRDRAGSSYPPRHYVFGRGAPLWSMSSNKRRFRTKIYFR